MTFMPVDKELTEDELNANKCRELYSGLYEGIRYYENECQCRDSDYTYWNRCARINAQ